MRKKVIVVVGARPQFIKAAVVSKALADHSALEEIIVHTGQHFDDNMSRVFFEQMGIPQPRHNLAIGGGSHGQNTGRMIEALEGVILAEQPAAVLVYGDTDSTLAGAIATSKLNIPLAHVEAGLRSFNRRMPEEINRVLTDHVSDLLFAPSESAVANLHSEGVAPPKIKLVGDVMFDAVQAFTEVAKRESTILADLALAPKSYALVTIHRKENTDDDARLSAFIEGLSQSPFPIVLPLHPRTRKRIADHGLTFPAHFSLIDPVGYLDMMALESSAAVIATDSGGVQKEAYFHGVPCITLRDETEWVELVDIGANVLVGADKVALSNAFTQTRTAEPVAKRDIYGDGSSSRQIAAGLLEYLS
ncbi:UDP-GlcNAc3NAcA epimerase [Devosia lucknowensis]|uniref:UDP-GlcNAc3NAcA epimerase n=1 Tax=Devosia lucknowensis TaxID=1096929 RepID=A0A1Y6GBU7_9HYPH|nr:UDP-N-acetylglucosamine 2-epimerase (non-hydrolyzing) [Devosia lucknowensis]SMQ85539.1 UDP-GlcNAc3NAcA epimerase [Devosia lucknowensis]